MMYLKGTPAMFSVLIFLHSAMSVRGQFQICLNQRQHQEVSRSQTSQRLMITVLLAKFSIIYIYYTSCPIDVFLVSDKLLLIKKKKIFLHSGFYFFCLVFFFVFLCFPFLLFSRFALCSSCIEQPFIYISFLLIKKKKKHSEFSALRKEDSHQGINKPQSHYLKGSFREMSFSLLLVTHQINHI